MTDIKQRLKRKLFRKSSSLLEELLNSFYMTPDTFLYASRYASLDTDRYIKRQKIVHPYKEWGKSDEWNINDKNKF